MAWRIVYYNAEVQQAVLEFPAGLQARYLHLTQRMEEFGPNLGMPHTLPMGKGLFELRMKSSEGIARVFFGNLTDERILVLHSFIKKMQKTPSKELKIARNRLKEALTRDDPR